MVDEWRYSGVLLKCFAPLSVSRVQTPILWRTTVWLTICVLLCCVIASVIWTTSPQQKLLLLYYKYRVTQKKVITKNRITSKNLFRLTQNFIYIRSSLCSRVSSLYYKNSLFHWRSKNVLQMSSPALQAHLDPAGKVLDDPPAFLPWDRSYCYCDCCL